MVWINWIDNLLKKLDEQFGEQIYWEYCLNNPVHKLGVKFGEIIEFKKFVEKWVDNLAEKIRWSSWVEKFSWKSLQCTEYSVQ